MANREYHIGQKVYGPNGEVIDETTTNLLPPGIRVIKLGITTIPGVKFKINTTSEGNNDQPPAIEIGRTGFFEIDLTNLETFISSIEVESGLNDIKKNYCYIDYVYYKTNTTIA